MASPSERRAAQRRLARQIRTRTYRPSQIGRKARATARRLEEQRRNPPPQDGEPVFLDGPSYPGIKVRIKRRKRIIFGDVVGFTPSRSDSNVDDSEDVTEMYATEDDPPDIWFHLASMASKAEWAVLKTGDAGELEAYLPFAFLFYHLGKREDHEGKR